jgi:HEAT repeat protein
MLNLPNSPGLREAGYMSRAQLGWLLILAHVLGCGAHDLQARMNTLVARGAYAEAVAATRAGGREPELEKALANAVLAQAASSANAERRRRAFGELQLAGIRARPLLDDLTRSGEPLTRALAWQALLQLGDDAARDALRPLADSADPELAALGYSALDAERDRRRLMAALTEPNRARRLAAVSVLGAGEPAPEVRIALESVAKFDPEAALRASALGALAHYGASATPAIERALADEAQPVRVAAISALARIAGERELLLVGRDLGSVPSAETLTAAAALLRSSPAREPERAQGVFERGLSSGDAALRAQAAVLCRTLRQPPCSSSVLRERLRAEPRAEIQLLLGLALGTGDALARSALAALAQTPSSVAVEAAAELAAIGDPAATQRLAHALAAPEPRVRMGALRAYGRIFSGGKLDAAPLRTPVADRLADADERVRTAAAAAVISAG